MLLLHTNTSFSPQELETVPFADSYTLLVHACSWPELLPSCPLPWFGPLRCGAYPSGAAAHLPHRPGGSTIRYTTSITNSLANNCGMDKTCCLSLQVQAFNLPIVVQTMLCTDPQELNSKRVQMLPQIFKCEYQKVSVRIRHGLARRLRDSPDTKLSIPRGTGRTKRTR